MVILGSPKTKGFLMKFFSVVVWGLCCLSISNALAQSPKPQAAVAPFAAIGKISEGEKKIVFMHLLHQLSKHYRLISQKEFEKAQSQAYESLEVEQCTEEQCIQIIQEMLQVEFLFILQMVREKSFTQISLTLMTLDDKRVAEDLCEQCDIKTLYNKIDQMVEQVIGVLKTEKSPPQTKAVSNTEEEIWNVVKNSNNKDDVDRFLKRFPNGKYAPAAQWKLEQIEREKKYTLQQQVDTKMIKEKQKTYDQVRKYAGIPSAVLMSICAYIFIEPAPDDEGDAIISCGPGLVLSAITLLWPKPPNAKTLAENGNGVYLGYVPKTKEISLNYHMKW